MKVLVTGAAGFLGRHFVEDMLGRGWDVWGVDDLSGQYSRWPDWIYDKKNEFKFRTVDVRAFLSPSISNDKNKVEWFDVIYHFAAPVGGRVKIEQDPMYNAESLAIDTYIFRAVAASKKKPLIVYPSSSAVYPVFEQGEKLKRLQENLFIPGEKAYGRPDEMYGFTKMAGEVLAHFCERYGVRTLCIRPFSGYGEDQPLEYPMSSIVLRAVKREDPLIVWGTGSQTRDFIHVDDIVRLTQMAVLGERGLEIEGTGIRRAGDEPDMQLKGYFALNLGTGIATSFVDVAKTAAKIVGYNPDIATLIDKPMGVQNRVADISRLQGYLIDMPKIKLEAGIERMVKHLEQNGTS